ncbi:MAG: hypothetical protein AAF933_12765 [Pseudomonadota bacterium]
MNRRAGKTATALAFAAELLGGCGLLAPDESMDGFMAQQREAAENAEAGNELVVALAHWRTLATLNPGDQRTRAKIEALETQINTRAEEAVQRGEAAYGRGESRAGDAAMLEALALKPGMERALTPLRASKSVAAHGRQDKKVAAEYAQRAAVEDEEQAAALQDALTLLEDSLAKGDYERVLAEAKGSESAMRDLTRRAHLGLADRAGKRGDRDGELHHLGVAVALANGEDKKLLAREEALRESLSDEAYQVGLELLQTDLARAIERFEQAMLYDPKNLAAKQKLEQAQKLKDNLERIRGA